MSLQPLRRVAVTRPVEQAADLIDALTATGVEVIAVPLTRIVPVEANPEIGAALARLDQYDLVVVTSVNGARCFGAALRSLKSEVPESAFVVAVGTATAAALAEAGITVSRVPDQASAAGILSSLTDLRLEGRRVLLPRSRAGRPELPDGLRARGMRVDDVAFYDTEPVVPDVLELDELLSADVVVVTAPSGVESLIAAAGRRAVGVRLVTIGPTTTASATDHGLTVVAEAATQSVPGLVAAVRAALTG